jgi:hypothetical protein
MYRRTLAATAAIAILSWTGLALATDPDKVAQCFDQQAAKYHIDRSNQDVARRLTRWCEGADVFEGTVWFNVHEGIGDAVLVFTDEAKKEAEAERAAKEAEMKEAEAQRAADAAKAARVARTMKAPDPHHYWVGMWTIVTVNDDGTESVGDYIYINRKGSDRNGVWMCQTLRTVPQKGGGAVVYEACAGEGAEKPRSSKTVYEPLPNGRMRITTGSYSDLYERIPVWTEYDPSGIGDLSCPATSHGC